MPAARLTDVRWFVDENSLGLGKLLDRVRDDVVHPGHPLVPHLPVGILDVDWMPVVAHAGWVVITRDRRIRTRPAERRIFEEEGLRSVWLAGRMDMRPADQLELVERHWSRLEREMIKRGAGPWALALTANGLRPLG